MSAEEAAHVSYNDKDIPETLGVKEVGRAPRADHKISVNSYAGCHALLKLKTELLSD